MTAGEDQFPRRSSGKLAASCTGASGPTSSSRASNFVFWARTRCRAKPVDRPVPRGRDQPAGGIGRFPLTRPPLGRDREGLLGGVLSQLDVTKDPGERRQHPPPVLAEDGVKRHGTALQRPAAPRSRRPFSSPAAPARQPAHRPGWPPRSRSPRPDTPSSR